MSDLLKHATQAASHWLVMSASQGPQVAVDFTKDHPYKVLYVAINTGVVMVTGPQGILAIPLKMLGFGHLGPVGGSSCYKLEKSCCSLPAHTETGGRH